VLRNWIACLLKGEWKLRGIWEKTWKRKKLLCRDGNDVRTVFIIYHELEIGEMDF